MFMCAGLPKLYRFGWGLQKVRERARWRRRKTFGDEVTAPLQNQSAGGGGIDNRLL